MKASKEFYHKNSRFFPSISFQENPVQPLLKLLADKEVSFIDTKTQKEKTGIAVLVKKTMEGGFYQFLTTSMNLIGQLAEIPEGSIVNIELRKQKTPEGFKSYFVVEKVGEEQITPEENEAISQFLTEVEGEE